MRNFRLAAAFFLMGWFGAHGDSFIQASFSHGDEPLVPQVTERDRPAFERASLLATVETACLAALLGALLARRRRRSWAGVTTLATLTAGPLNGALLGYLILGHLAGVPPALVMGLFYGAIYLPAVWLLGHAELERHSLADSRRLWRCTLLVMLLSAVIGRAVGVGPSLAAMLTGPRAAALLALPAGLVLLFLDLRDRRRLSQGRVSASLPAGPYREMAPVRATRGDLSQVALLLRRAVVSDALLIAGALAVWLTSG